MRKWQQGSLGDWQEDWREDAPQGCESIVLTLRFITPVFGGGVDPKRADPVTPVRGAAIRGQLRFWWRATSALTHPAELREREVELFGGVHGKGPVASRLELAVTRQPGRAKELAVYEDGNPFRKQRAIGKGLAYGAFPLRATERPLKHDKLLCYKDDFELTLRFPADVRAEIERALAAFLHLGGLGGRTRRGFGALELRSARGFTLPPTSELPKGDIRAPWPTYQGCKESASKAGANWPKMPAQDAHDRALRLLFDMRQNPGDGRNHGQGNRPGRSFWPEPDAIRKIYRTRGPHAQPFVDVGKFPRAKFGAPIIFHFKDRPDPPDTTLVPEGKSRLASPLLIRPHAEAGGYAILAARIQDSSVSGWELQERGRKKASVEVDLTAAEAGKIQPLGDRPDPIEAYFQGLRDL